MQKVFKNAKEALKGLDETTELIITDINMPEIDGFEMAKLIHKNIDTDTPIVAVSAYDCNDYSLQDVIKNFSYYIRKPIKIKDLLIGIDKAIKQEQFHGC